MTWAPTPAILEAALAHAAACRPAESCGVVAGGAFVPIANNATEIDSFVMDLRAYLAIDRAEGVEAIVHSHVYGQPIASDADRATCELVGKPWLIVSWPNGNHVVIEPCGFRAPLIGRKWAWGPHDCYGLIRDAFQDYTGISLPDFERDWQWWKGGDIIREHFAEAGFVEVDDAWRHCDVIGMRISAPVVNHLGLFLDPDQMLHQLVGRHSVRELYGGMYVTATALHVRHRRFLEAPGYA
jgi:proteasome lid subunit RPN8/RPN11